MDIMDLKSIKSIIQNPSGPTDTGIASGGNWDLRVLQAVKTNCGGR